MFPARELIKQWLTAGVVEQGRWSPTERGTPQGGIASPVLLNVALHGMEQAAGVRYYTDRDGNPAEAVRNVPIVVRYADLCRARHKSAYAACLVMPRGVVESLVSGVGMTGWSA
jgi:RNA-directed DNA polymerase